ncbi:MAG: hypothetical protein ACRDV4_00060 [Acidimicrobiales bacterium]
MAPVPDGSRAGGLLKTRSQGSETLGTVVVEVAVVGDVVGVVLGGTVVDVDVVGGDVEDGAVVVEDGATVVVDDEGCDGGVAPPRTPPIVVPSFDPPKIEESDRPAATSITVTIASAATNAASADPVTTTERRHFRSDEPICSAGLFDFADPSPFSCPR